MYYGLIEAGGTKFVLGVASADGTILARHRLPTTSPEETLGQSISWLADQGYDLAAIGLASFGPLNLDRAHAEWGSTTRTTKPLWSGTDLVSPFARAFGCPVGLETDVNGAALAEATWGAGRGFGSLLYLTVGTGVGGGFVAGGRLLQGMTHPEMGHIPLPRHPHDTAFPGHCAFHGDCLEGLVAGPAVMARWAANLSDLGPDHEGADIVAWYLGAAIVTYQAILAPARIVLGGGVMATPGLIERIRDYARSRGGEYFAGNVDEIVTRPGLGNNSGLLGALAVALEAAGHSLECSSDTWRLMPIHSQIAGGG
ncbi:fructokinase [Novosphingobium sp. CF614]|uniref:ROK family protein n=1 Tax=Novosphingobium sp. CF614 TaxID=1884364 RepID=UPI0008E93E6F|nr:ROK family protein [Novosphingobium sp. CF614]SFG08108.1 fructokinase [Novosphingobium sp. CF614]